MTDQGEYFRMRDDAATDPEYQPRYLHVMQDLLGLNLEPGLIRARASVVGEFLRQCLGQSREALDTEVGMILPFTPNTRTA